MTWNYSGDPSSSEKDAVRFLIGDTDSNDELLQDEEINYLLNEEGNPQRAAVEAARSIAAKFSRQADYSIGDESEDLSQKAESYNKLANKLEREANMNVMAYAGGLSESEKETFREDTDAVKPDFAKDMMEHNNNDYRFVDDDCE